jgi:hypothetical protein
MPLLKELDYGLCQVTTNISLLAELPEVSRAASKRCVEGADLLCAPSCDLRFPLLHGCVKERKADRNAMGDWSNPYRRIDIDRDCPRSLVPASSKP